MLFLHHQLCLTLIDISLCEIHAMEVDKYRWSGKEFIISPAAEDSEGVSCVKEITPKKKSTKQTKESPIYSYLLRRLEYVIIPLSKKFQVGVFLTEVSLTLKPVSCLYYLSFVTTPLIFSDRPQMRR